MKTILALFLFGTIAATQAQETSVRSETNINAHSNKITYYQERGAEDAKFELAFTAKTKAEEKAFWKEQKAYEKELKKKNRKAYRAYIASKKEVYTTHHYSCDAHCHHSDAFYNHAEFYYYQYNQPSYQRSTSYPAVRTQIGVRAPSVRLGL